MTHTVYAVPLAELDDTKEWRVENFVITGNKAISEEELRNEMLTKVRPWYQFWSARPVFDPVTFESDLGRLRRFYEARGYYHAEIAEDLSTDESNSRVGISIRIDEGPPVVIGAVEVNVTSDLAEDQRPALPDSLPVATGDVFREAAYLEAEQKLREVFLRNGFAHVDSTRRAEISLENRQAQIEYSLTPGPPTVFGATEIRGTSNVEPNLIERELAYRSGEIFSSEKVAATRAKLLALDLFSSVRVAPEPTTGNPPVVPMAVEVTDKPHREIKVGVGYSTEEEFRGQLEWRHLNWLGGGRQLSAQAKYSSVSASGAVDLVQPHFFTPAAKGTLSFKYEQQEEDTYHRNFGRFLPKVDHQFMPGLSGFVGFRAEYNKLFEISQATEQALGNIRKRGWVSGPALGIVWNTTDNLFEPKKGAVLSLTLEQAGAIWGGSYRFYKITGEAKKYYDIGWDTILAARVKLGLGDAIGAKDRFPLFERFYAGGENSVRGYGRRRLGPLSDDDDPLGGLSLLEGSLELRRPIWRDLGGAVFVDFGQVATRPFDVRVTNLDFSAGFGFSYKTPVGPVRLDVGFPFQKPPKDRPWQIHFSIGALF
jgi:outer membrane protein assembly complex protein YaeT